ncbi:hypothetical protein GCM10009550_71590 [Actinocorallia libanotica]|uniref:Thiopeptide-type bacteriocin biosynthesis protein n=1 Tax=Actinocorallia libanotica TaxID=46162 RepID=A0ABP4CEP4_9ACTN
MFSDGHRLFVWSDLLNQTITPVLHSRLSLDLVPPVARLLTLLGRSGTRPWQTWSWGTLTDAPWTPRVVRGSVILHPARWAIPSELRDVASDREKWGKALDRWRTTALPSPPSIVITDQADRHLPLDLDHPTDRELLRRYVRRGLCGLFEPFGGPDTTNAILPGPDGSHVLEIAVPLFRRTSPTNPSSPAPRPRPVGDGLFLPGSLWLSLAIPAPRHHQDRILAELRQVITDHGHDLDLWFWLRYSNPTHGPHLRLRFHGDPRILTGHLLPSISVWCSDLLTRRMAGGLTIEPYDQEIERYGGTNAIEKAELVFAADSHLVLSALNRTSDDRLVLAAQSAADIVTTLANGDRTALRGARTTRQTRPHYERLRARTRMEREDGDAWTDRHKTLVAYREALTPESTTACASSLVHMHVNRIASNTDEPLIRALAIDLLARTR